MDAQRFDGLAYLAAQPASRRAVALGLVGIGASAAVPLPVSGGAKRRRRKCLRHGRRCGKKSGQRGGSCKRCCGRFSLSTSRALIPTGKRRCACRPDGMACSKNRQCCNGVCNPETRGCDDGLPASEPEVCVTGVNFCQQGEQQCGNANCACVNTNQGDVFCSNGQFTCSPMYANVTCHDDNDCYNDFGETFVCVSMSACSSSVACSGPGGTACAQICGS